MIAPWLINDPPDQFRAKNSVLREHDIDISIAAICDISLCLCNYRRLPKKDEMLTT